MKSIIRILFAMLILATIFVPLQAALTPSPSTSTTPVAAVATKTIGDRHPLHPLALPADITAATPAELQASPEASPRARAKRSKVVYLTFDDGPGGAYTLEVLADLQAAGAHGTFFETGDCTAIGSFGGVPDGSMYPTSGMNINPAIPAQLLAAGNQIGTHSWDHPDFPTLKTAAAANAEIGNARALQVRLTGHDSKLFRYPFRDPSLAGNQISQATGHEGRADGHRAERLGPSRHRCRARQHNDGTGVQRRDRGPARRDRCAGSCSPDFPAAAANATQESGVQVRNHSGSVSAR